ncbi:MAG: HlyD family secretion protein, partial [Pseudomonadota bacterium]
MDERISNPTGGRKRLLRIGAGAAGLVLVAALAAVVLGGPARSARIDRDAVTIATVEHGVFRDFTTLQGKIAARDTIYLDAQEGGQVQKILVEAGDRVVTGQPLVELRNSELELEVLSQEGRLVESITQLQAYGKELEQNRAENERALARIDYDVLRLSRQVERRERLLAQGYVPREHVDQLRDELNYNSKLRPLQAQTNRRQETLRLAQLPHIATELASLQESLRITRAKLGDLIVKAPVQGRARKLIVRRVYPQVRNGTFTVDLDFAGDTPNDLSAGEAVFGKLSLGRDHKATVLKAGPYLQGSNGSWVFVLN